MQKPVRVFADVSCLDDVSISGEARFEYETLCVELDDGEVVDVCPLVNVSIDHYGDQHVILDTTVRVDVVGDALVVSEPQLNGSYRGVCMQGKWSFSPNTGPVPTSPPACEQPLRLEDTGRYRALPSRVDYSSSTKTFSARSARNTLLHTVALEGLLPSGIHEAFAMPMVLNVGHAIFILARSPGTSWTRQEAARRLPVAAAWLALDAKAYVAVHDAPTLARLNAERVRRLLRPDSKTSFWLECLP